jgi:3',5'-cyclic AMP phosphodiesterase CpdA
MAKVQFFVGLVLVSILTPLISLAKPLRIGIIGDQTQSDDLAASYAILEKGVAKLNTLSVDVALHVGDLVDSNQEEDQIAPDFAQATDRLNHLNAPWFLTPGNHDIDPPYGATEFTENSRRDFFQMLYGRTNPQFHTHLYYSFDVGPVHFIALSSVEHFHSDPRWGNILFAKLSEEQRDWLREDLERNRRKAIVVFTHMPLWYNVTDWAEVHALLRQYPVKAVIAGHFHYNQRDQWLDGIQYAVVGATGGTIKQASANAGGMHHVTVLEIDGKQLDFKLYPIEGTIREEPLPKETTLTPRFIMDRVQMVDDMLSLQEGYKYYDAGLKLADFASLPPCQSSENWILAVPFLGNPIDTKITLEFSVSLGPGDYIDSRFRPNSCRSVPGNDGKTRCTLPPERAIAVASPYWVEGNEFDGYTDALFFGEVIPDDPAGFTADRLEDLELTIRFSLDSGNDIAEDILLKSDPFYIFDQCVAVAP